MILSGLFEYKQQTATWLLPPPTVNCHGQMDWSSLHTNCASGCALEPSRVAFITIPPVFRMSFESYNGRFGDYIQRARAFVPSSCSNPKPDIQRVDCHNQLEYIYWKTRPSIHQSPSLVERCLAKSIPVSGLCQM